MNLEKFEFPYPNPVFFISFKGLILESYGAGNAPNNRPEILAALSEASHRGIVIVNVTQCKRGLVMDIYSTGKALAECGVVAGSDMTPEVHLSFN